jgi:uncharacterized membrane protein
MEQIDIAAFVRIVLRLVHALAGAIWLGSGAYLLVALTPLRGVVTSAQDTLRAAQLRFRRWWVIASALLLGSGVALMFDRLADGRGTALYVILLLVKVAAGLLALAATGGLLPRGASWERGSATRAWLSGRTVLLLGSLAYLLGVLLSVIYPPDPTAGWR